MASVAKWLRQWFVVPPFVGSIPIVRPSSVSCKLNTTQNWSKFDDIDLNSDSFPA